MKIKIFDSKNNEKGAKELPQIFQEEIRPDIIGRAVYALQSGARQPYGSDPRAGKKCSAKLSRRRRKYKGSYGHGISRVPRKILSRNGTRFNWVGAFSPGTVGGRRAHPPKTTKIWLKKINIKERRKAIRSAVAATVNKELVKERGHVLPDKYPFMLDNNFENIAKTGDILEALKIIGLESELQRAEIKTYRAGRPRMRGRKYRKRKGPLLVVSKKCPLLNAVANIPGVDAVVVNELNAELLAPGAVPGRLTLFTESAVNLLAKENLFYENSEQKNNNKQEKKQSNEKERSTKKKDRAAIRMNSREIRKETASKKKQKPQEAESEKENGN
jgi:large subunit ribosomal protein L4e